MNVASNVQLHDDRDPRTLRRGDRLPDGRVVIKIGLTAVAAADGRGDIEWIGFARLRPPRPVAPLVRLSADWTPGPRPDALMVDDR